MKRVLITGAGSYIGTSVDKHLTQWPDRYQVDTLDMLSDTWMEKSFAGYDAVFHVAGIAHQDAGRITRERKQQYYQVNTELTISVAQKAKADGVGQFVFMSSIIVYGAGARMGERKVITRETVPAPEGAYGDSKLQAEIGILRLSDNAFKLCILRAPMIYGPGSKGNYALLEKVAIKLPLFPDVQNERSMLHIRNLCEYVKDCIDNGLSGIHFPQNDEYVCTSRMVQEVAGAVGKNVRLTKIFNPLLRLMSGRIRIVDKVFGSLVYEQTVPYQYVPDLVSVVMPAYNAADYIEMSIKSVLGQSYANLELIVVDDESTDDTIAVIEKLQSIDDRICLLRQMENAGAGAARNLSIEAAKGEFIAFVDSDDLWEADKLEKQITYMRKYNTAFTCTDYAVIDEYGHLTGEVREATHISDYNTLLKQCPGNSTVVYQAGKLGKFYIPPIRKRNDYAMWLAVIKRAEHLYGISETLSYYRVHSGGLSANKASLLKFHYKVYRDIEKLSMLRTVRLLAFWSTKTVRKRIGDRRTKR